MTKKIAVTLEVANHLQAQELNEAWQEIVSGQKLARAEALEHGTEAIMERARPAIEIIETAIREHPTSGQAGRLVRFLAAIYNGYDYAFDLTELRALDTRLANACLDYLSYDRLCKQEAHHHLAGGARELHRWIEDYRVEPRIQLHRDDEQAARLLALIKRSTRHPNELAREAFNVVLEKYEGQEFGSLIAPAAEQSRRGDGEPPLSHARRLSEAGNTPLCGAQGANWQAGPFHFDRLTCQTCKDIMLGYESHDE
jgi:hypothetical protein